MATVDTMRQPATLKPTFNPVIDNMNVATKPKLQDVHFDPKVHLEYEEPESIVMMEEIGYSKDMGISPMAVSQPFHMFSDEAIEKFREEVLSDVVKENCKYESNIAPCQLRGYAPK